MNAANQCGKRPTILLVDDHAPTRESYAAYLHEEGYDILQAAHGGEAILLVVEREVDLAMVDIRMPVLGGIEFAGWLRSVLPAAGTPILAITACDSRVEQAQMRSVCDDLLLKPCAPHLVASRVRALLAPTWGGEPAPTDRPV